MKSHFKNISSFFWILAFIFPFYLFSMNEVPFWKNCITKNINVLEPCGVSFVDACFLINLDYRTDRLSTCMKMFEEHGLQVTRVPAIWGKQLTDYELANLGISYHKSLKGKNALTYINGNPKLCKVNNDKLTYFSKYMSRGALGCILSHLSVICSAFEMGLQRIWVFEDDIFFFKPAHHVKELIDEADLIYGKNGWDLIYTNPNKGDTLRRPDLHYFEENQTIKYSELLSPVKTRWGTYSMIINRTGIEKIYHFFSNKAIFGPIDNDLHCIPNFYQFEAKIPYTAHNFGVTSDNY